jgi:hypothetical protein
MLVPKLSKRKSQRGKNQSLLKKKFQIIRKKIFDNYFTNEDTIALANGKDDNYFLDMSTNPLRLKHMKNINMTTDFWLKPNFHASGPGEELKQYQGPIGFRTWPGNHTIRTKDPKNGAKLEVVKGASYKFMDDMRVEKVGHESIIL